MAEEETEEKKYQIHYEDAENVEDYCTKDGKASVIYANGDTFNGGLSNGKKHGSGTYTWVDGSKYDGEWNEDVKEGMGKFSYPDGSSYQGNWKNNQKNGEGTYLYTNGDSYSGSWQNGIREGKGIYTIAASHSKLVGEWKEDKFISGNWRWSDGTIYSGKFNQNEIVGCGTFQAANGNQINGSFDKMQWKTNSIC